MSASAAAISWSSFVVGVFVGIMLTLAPVLYTAYTGMKERNDQLVAEIPKRVETREKINERETGFKAGVEYARRHLQETSGCEMSDSDREFIRVRNAEAEDSNRRADRRRKILEDRLRSKAPKDS